MGNRKPARVRRSRRFVPPPSSPPPPLARVEDRDAPPPATHTEFRYFSLLYYPGTYHFKLYSCFSTIIQLVGNYCVQKYYTSLIKINECSTVLNKLLNHLINVYRSTLMEWTTRSVALHCLLRTTT